MIQNKHKAGAMIMVSSIIILLIIYGLSSAAYAAKGDIGNGKMIPDYMKPGTIIKYVDDDKYEIVKGGEPEGGKYRDREEIPKEEPLLGYEEYPEPEKGMIVFYAGDGQVNRIVFATEEAEMQWREQSPEQEKKQDETSKNDDSGEEASDTSVEWLITRCSFSLIVEKEKL
ncbi:MAG: hypothetical protein ACOYJU_03115 [Anaerovoracaceae bacterium]|jgi:hypothetical protein